ncbi:hypothetical protein SAMD00019534_121320 [Acytostelium subglobosum LB1]|uniref:hypothetical protein n=1 Tax=Acytostelium subglobosum LB1 TaxID=1410327 RepID=UPI0006448741|nr:hypothetical protein SAMD00019534_121320 [Acytostelium subglobosum LB1]GAM28956.1 hypothetical protein SAMD00019534_121320 [Acytostelium subglobosum LB1]|eukprot:XP_012748141.1 hypothetical protein SAMD00019534_121320 [Acytostelium subglobosum LB1]
MFNSFKNLSIWRTDAESLPPAPAAATVAAAQPDDQSQQQQQNNDNSSNTVNETQDGEQQPQQQQSMFGLNRVSTDTFKSIGSKFSMFASNVISKIDEERKKLMEESEQSDRVRAILNEPLPPWMDFKLDDQARQREAVDKILDVKMSKKTFLTSPPIDSDYCQEFDTALIQIATVSLKYDRQLEKIRFLLVPRFISEEQFWKNWYYRVTLIRREYNIVSNVLTAPSKATPSSSSSSNVHSDNNDRDTSTSTTTTTTMDNNAGGGTNNNNNNNNQLITFTDSSSSDISNWEKELMTELDGFKSDNIDLSMNNDLLLDDEDEDTDIGNLKSTTTTTTTGDKKKENETTDNDEDEDEEVDSDAVIDEELEREVARMKLTPNNGEDESEDDLLKEIEAEISSSSADQLTPGVTGLTSSTDNDVPRAQLE